MERTRLLVGLYFFAAGLVIYLPIFIAHNLTSCLVYSPNGGGLVTAACPPISNDALITEYMGWFCALGGLAFALSDIFRRKSVTRDETDSQITRR